MTSLSVAAEVIEAFSDLRIVAVVADGVEGGAAWPEVTSQIAGIEQAVAEGSWRPAGEDDPRISDWHEAYRSFGTNPRRQRPSADALCRRLARTGRLPRINAAVDCYNLVSVMHVIPIGAFNLEKIAGDVMIRFARPDDTFTPLGEPEATEVPCPGEVVYAEGHHVLTRHWNHRDAERIKVNSTSQCILFLLETTKAVRHRAELSAATQDLQDLLAAHSRSVAVHTLDASYPRLELGGRRVDP
jgi:DNA/RNA-binding domain of Phe-tRNA-synthetase-like protein